MRYVVPVAISAFLLGVVASRGSEPEPPAPEVRVITREVITEEMLARLEDIARQFAQVPAGELTPGEQATLGSAEDVVEGVESGDVIVVPQTPPTTAAPAPPASPPPTVEPGGDRDNVFDYVPPTLPEVTVP